MKNEANPPPRQKGISRLARHFAPCESSQFPQNRSKLSAWCAAENLRENSAWQTVKRMLYYNIIQRLWRKVVKRGSLQESGGRCDRRRRCFWSRSRAAQVNFGSLRRAFPVKEAKAVPVSGKVRWYRAFLRPDMGALFLFFRHVFAAFSGLSDKIFRRNLRFVFV